MITAEKQKLRIPRIENPLSSEIPDPSGMLRCQGVSVVVEQINWSDYPVRPPVLLRAGYTDHHLWLHWEVQADFFRARATQDQEAVWEDTCVEFFSSARQGEEVLSFEQIKYQNFEFNALGVCLAAYGIKSERTSFGPDEMNQILRFPSVGKTDVPAEDVMMDWSLTVAIPLIMLALQPGQTFRANFYKCGDLTLQPHFLSWRAIVSEVPDFHLPQFFGEAELAVG